MAVQTFCSLLCQSNDIHNSVDGCLKVFLIRHWHAIQNSPGGAYVNLGDGAAAMQPGNLQVCLIKTRRRASSPILFPEQPLRNVDNHVLQGGQIP